MTQLFTDSSCPSPAATAKVSKLLITPQVAMALDMSLCLCNVALSHRCWQGQPAPSERGCWGRWGQARPRVTLHLLNGKVRDSPGCPFAESICKGGVHVEKKFHTWLWGDRAG